MHGTILFTGGSLDPKEKERVEQQGYEVRVARLDLDEDELIEALHGVQAYILAGYEKATARIINAASDLKVVCFFGAGYESYVDTAAATARGIAVTNTPGANAESVAELTLALALDASKRLTYLITETKRGGWKEVRGWDLSGKTIGIVGMGHIGARVAQIARTGFNMNVLYTSRTPKPAVEAQYSATFVDLDTLLRNSDVVSLHVNWSPDKAGIIGGREFGLMKPTAILVNTARAGLVDPQALRTALVDRRIFAAAFDGYFEEPAPSVSEDKFGLLTLSDEFFIVSPHTGYNTEDAIQNMTRMSFDSAINVLAGRNDPFIVNPAYQAVHKKA